MISLNGGVATDNYYNGQLAVIIGGTGIGQARQILSYNGTNTVATVTRDWTTIPDATSEFVVSAADVPSILEAGTATAGAAGSITLDAGASAISNTYQNNIITITGGTGLGQTRAIGTYNGDTKVANVIPDWTTTPDATSIYQVYPLGRVDIGAVSGDVDASDTLEAWLDGYADVQLTNREKLFAMGLTVDSIYDTILVVKDSVTLVFSEVENLDAWNPITDNDSLIVDQSTLEDMTVATVTDVTNGVTLANDAITAAKIAADAIGASEIAANAIGASELATGAITADEIAAGAITSSEIADNAIDAGAIADDAIDYGTFAATAPTAWWNEGKTSYTLTATEWEKVWYDIDTTNIDTSEIGTWLSTGVNATIDYEQIWYNIDTTNIDTSELGTWLSTGVSVSIDSAEIARSVWDDDVVTTRALTELDEDNTTIDLNGTEIVAADTLAGGDSTASLTDTNYLATTTDFWRNIDSSATLDTSDIGAWMENNLTAAGQWTTIKVDSIMDLVRSDSLIHYKSWGDSSARAITGTVVPDDTTASGALLSSTSGFTLNLIRNGGFEEGDSVSGATAPQGGWYQAHGTFGSGCEIRTSTVGGQREYRIYKAGAGTETFILSQCVGYLDAGHYLLSGTFNVSHPSYRSYLVIDSGYHDDISASAWYDSIPVVGTESESDKLIERSKRVTLYDSTMLVVGCVAYLEQYQSAIFDNIKLEYLGPLSIVAQDTVTTGDTLGVNPSHWVADDSVGYQGAASGLTAAQVADAVWDEDTTGHNTANSYGELVEDTSAYQADAVSVDSAEIARAVWDNDVVAQASRDVDSTNPLYIHIGRIWAMDTSGAVAGMGLMLKDTAAYQAENAVPHDTTATGKYVGLKPSGWSAADTAAYQGATSPGAVAQAIKDTADAYPGTFYGPSATGAGAYARTVVIVDSTGWQHGAGDALSALANIRVAVYGDTLQTSMLAVNNSESDGSQTFNVDAGMIVYVCDQPGYTFPGNGISGIDTVTIAGTGTDTVWCYHADAGMTTVWGLLTDLGADSLDDVTVTFSFNKKQADIRRDTDSAKVWSGTGGSKRAITSNGRWEIEVYATSALHTATSSSPVAVDSVLYDVTFNYAGGVASYKRINVPDTTTINWKDIR
jgi:hypothetical protein